MTIREAWETRKEYYEDAEELNGKIKSLEILRDKYEALYQSHLKDRKIMEGEIACNEVILLRTEINTLCLKQTELCIKGHLVFIKTIYATYGNIGYQMSNGDWCIKGEWYRMAEDKIMEIDGKKYKLIEVE